MITQTRTKAGHLVRIFDQDSGGDYPILGAYLNEDEWVPCKWYADGRFPSIGKNFGNCPLDIYIDTPKEVA